MTIMVYRAADKPNPEVWDWLVEHKVIAEDDLDAHLTDGWSKRPDEVGAASDPEEAPKRRGRPPKAVEGETQ